MFLIYIPHLVPANGFRDRKFIYFSRVWKKNLYLKLNKLFLIFAYVLNNANYQSFK